MDSVPATDVPIAEEVTLGLQQRLEKASVDSAGGMALVPRAHSVGDVNQIQDVLHLMCETAGKSGPIPSWKFRIITNDILQYNGDCLFMALAQYLFPDCDATEALQYHPLIRHTIVSFLTRPEKDMVTWKRFSIWLKNNHQARIKEFRNYIPDSPCKNLHTRIQKAYKKYMLRDGNFGTMAELDAAMELFGFRTTLVQEDVAEKQFSVYNTGDSEWTHHLYLLFTGHSDGGHFQKLDMLSPDGEIPAGKHQMIDISRENCTMTLAQVKPNSPECPSRPGQVGSKRPAADVANEVTKRAKGDCETSGAIISKPDLGSKMVRSELSASENESTNSILGSQLKTQLLANFPNACEVDHVGDESKSSDDVSTSRPLTPEVRDSTSTYYLYVPPWASTIFHKALDNLVGEVQEKAFILLDIRSVLPERQSLSLRRNKFMIKANDHYRLKNVTEQGIFVKFTSV